MTIDLDKPLGHTRIRVPRRHREPERRRWVVPKPNPRREPRDGKDRDKDKHHTQDPPNRAASTGRRVWCGAACLRGRGRRMLVGTSNVHELHSVRRASDRRAAPYHAPP